MSGGENRKDIGRREVSKKKKYQDNSHGKVEKKRVKMKDSIELCMCNGPRGSKLRNQFKTSFILAGGGDTRF